MRVVFPMLQLDQTGGSRVIVEIANGLLRRGHTVMLIVPRASQSHWFHIEAPVVEVGIPWIPQRVNIKNPINSFILCGCIPQADIVVANFYLTAYPVYVRTRLLRRSRAFYLVQGYEPLFMEDALSPIKRIVAQQSYHLPLNLLVVSNWLRDVIRGHHGRDAVIVNPGVNRDIFYPQLTIKEKRVAHPRIILTIGRRQGLKGLTDCVQAVEQVHQQYRDIHLVILTQESLAIDASVPISYVRPSSDEELATWYNRASVYVHASHYEGFGLPPLEAMSCGTAVVTTDSGGVREYTQHTINCLLVPPRNTEALAAAITTVLRDEGLAFRLGQAGIQTAQRFTWSNTVDQVEAAFQNCRAG